jgi:hypothetical protein
MDTEEVEELPVMLRFQTRLAGPKLERRSGMGVAGLKA